MAETTTAANTAELEKAVKQIFLNGLSSGTVGTCLVVIDTCRDKSKSAETRLKLVEKFCELAMEEHAGKLDAQIKEQAEE